jgi:YfiH family protein
LTDFYTENNILRCRALDLPGLVHAFSTRNGGVSVSAHTKSLNLGYGRGDDDLTVDENRRIFASLAGFDVAGLVTAEQIHSANVVYADGSVNVYGDCDGFVTDVPGVFIAVKTADCQPILFADPGSRVVGACHAGWRGTVAGIAAATVKEMEKLGAKRETTVAVLGPCIGKCCFEVKDDFTDSVRKAGPAFLRFIDSYHADIKAMNEYVLLNAGILKENIYVCPDCTCCMGEKYYSHRRQKGVRGTMLNVIGMC